MDNKSIANKYQDMRVKDLKHILEQLPDDMAVIIPVIDEKDANHIYGFRYVRTAGVLISEGEQDREVLCLNAAADGQDIADQVYFSGRDVGVKNVLFADADDICENVLADVFGEDCMFSTDEYDTLCTIIEKTLASVSENPEKL